MEKTGIYKLSVKKAGTKKAQELFRGNYWACLTYYHRQTPWSFMLHHKFIDDVYTITKVKTATTNKKQKESLVK